MKTSTLNLGRIADGVGIFGATACALHCVALPILLVLGTALPTVFLGGESFHLAMLGLVVPSALIAFSSGCRRHKDLWVLTLGALGLVGMVLAATVLHDLLGEGAEKVATIGAAVLLVSAHVRNFKLCQTEACTTCEA